MVAVAVLAIGLGASLWRQRMRDLSALYREHGARSARNSRSATLEAAQAERYAALCLKRSTLRGRPTLAEEFGMKRVDGEDEVRGYWGISPKEWRERAERAKNVAARWRRTAAHFARLQMKYDRAAPYPWLPVAPDPPVPE